MVSWGQSSEKLRMSLTENEIKECRFRMIVIQQSNKSRV